MIDSRKVKKCKKIRDRIYDLEKLGDSVFKIEVLKLLSPQSIIVDIGCGKKAIFLRSLSSHIKKAYGIDLEVSTEIIDGNIHIIHGDAESIPLPECSVDIITMAYVAEHLQNPKKVLIECKRILKPGGSVILIAPCKFYLPIFFGRAVPHCIKRRLNRLITSTDSDETFPAYYKANSRRALLKLSYSVGLKVVKMKYIMYHPEYSMFSVPLYRCMVALERFVLQCDALSFLRHQILCHMINLNNVDYPDVLVYDRKRKYLRGCLNR